MSKWFLRALTGYRSCHRHTRTHMCSRMQIHSTSTKLEEDVSFQWLSLSADQGQFKLVHLCCEQQKLNLAKGSLRKGTRALRIDSVQKTRLGSGEGCMQPWKAHHVTGTAWPGGCHWVEGMLHSELNSSPQELNSMREIPVDLAWVTCLPPSLFIKIYCILAAQPSLSFPNILHQSLSEWFFSPTR